MNKKCQEELYLEIFESFRGDLAVVWVDPSGVGSKGAEKPTARCSPKCTVDRLPNKPDGRLNALSNTLKNEKIIIFEFFL
jgi:hypothetical protein